MLYVCRQKLLYFFILLLTLGCQNHRYSEEGLPAPDGNVQLTSSYPAVVMVLAPNGQGLCTGTFISERAVLTAAHCAKSIGKYTVFTSFGTFGTSIVEKFGPGVVDDPNDIALLIFETPVASRELNQVYGIHDDIREGDKVRLVGYGCDNIDTRTGSGLKRTGTNVVANISDYIEFLTPRSSSNLGVKNSRGILGPENRSGSCFGDSGGPALIEMSGEYKVVGVTHAGSSTSSYLISEYVNVANNSSNRQFLSYMNTYYGLEIEGI